jgi:hypothetical protein
MARFKIKHLVSVSRVDVSSRVSRASELPGDFEGPKAGMTRSGFTWLDIADDPVLTSPIV